MDEIQAGNLQGEVVVLRELVRMLVGEMPDNPDTTQKIVLAMDRARAAAPAKTPDRISIDHAINTLKPHGWVQR